MSIWWWDQISPHQVYTWLDSSCDSRGYNYIAHSQYLGHEMASYDPFLWLYDCYESLSELVRKQIKTRAMLSQQTSWHHGNHLAPLCIFVAVPHSLWLGFSPPWTCQEAPAVTGTCCCYFQPQPSPNCAVMLEASVACREVPPRSRPASQPGGEHVFLSNWHGF